MALDDKTGGTLSQDDIDKLMGGSGEEKKGTDVDQDKMAEEWAPALESGAEIDGG